MCMGEGCDVGAAITAYFLYLLVSAGTTAVWAIFVSVLAPIHRKDECGGALRG